MLPFTLIQPLMRNFSKQNATSLDVA